MSKADASLDLIAHLALAGAAAAMLVRPRHAAAVARSPLLPASYALARTATHALTRRLAPPQRAPRSRALIIRRAPGDQSLDQNVGGVLIAVRLCARLRRYVGFVLAGHWFCLGGTGERDASEASHSGYLHEVAPSHRKFSPVRHGPASACIGAPREEGVALMSGKPSARLKVRPRRIFSGEPGANRPGSRCERVDRTRRARRSRRQRSSSRRSIGAARWPADAAPLRPRCARARPERRCWSAGRADDLRARERA